MSEAAVVETTVDCTDEARGIETKDSKKQKRNARRRKSRKIMSSTGSGVTTCTSNAPSNNLKVDQVVDFLCKSITDDRFETAVGNFSKSEFSVPCTPSEDSSYEIKDNLSASSAATTGLTCLFENLQVHTLKNPVSSINVTEFLNVDLLKETGCKTLTAIEELDKIKQGKFNDVKVDPAQSGDIPKEKMKDYFNLDLIRESPEESLIGKIESSSMRLVAELEKSICSSEGCLDDEANDRYLAEYFNVKALKEKESNLVAEIETTSKLLVSELGKTLFDSNASRKGLEAKKKKRFNDNYKKSNEETDETFDGRQKVFLNSSLTGINRKRRKKKEKKKGETDNDVEDVYYPKHLSQEELESASKYGVLLTGVIRINQKNYREAYITAPDKGADILIEGLKDRNRALDGDEVYFVLKSRESDSNKEQRRAVVVGIKTQNHSRKAIGVLKTSSVRGRKNNFYWFSPRDSRLPRFKISREKMPPGFFENAQDFKDILYFAQILRWDDMRFAEGELIKEVGTAGDIATETTALLLKYDLDVTPFPESLNKYFPSSPFRIPEDELLKREDLRKDCVFTIDPATARDLDDAVSCKKLPNGNYLVGVHISDVSYFLGEGTPLDEAVRNRATTVYLVQEVHHMLPRELCGMCSLTPGEDKLSFSVFWEIARALDGIFEIVDRRFVRTIINSCAQLSYQQVQNVLEGQSEETFWTIHGDHSLREMKEKIVTLNEMAKCFRKSRFVNGALRIDQTKICFSLNEEGMPREYFVYQNQESHQLIEEFMLLANVTVAEEIARQFPKIAFLRSHSVPLAYVLEKLQKNLEKYGIILDISSSGALQSSVSKYGGEDVFSVARMLVLNNALAKPMARAKYYCSDVFPESEDRKHYALNVPLYTHFTSPIRRYADVMVHRLLAGALNYQEAPNWAVDDVHRIAANCNKRKYGAKMAGEASTELFLSVYVGLKGPLICDAVVCDIKDKSFDCIVLSTGTHQRIYYEQIDSPLSLKEEEDGTQRLVIRWPKEKDCDSDTVQIVEIFTIVQVELRKTNVLKIEAKLLKCNPNGEK